MASWTVNSSPDQAVQVGALAGTLCCVLRQDNLLTVPLSTPVYKWVPANLNAAMNQHSIQEYRNIPSCFMLQEQG